MIDNSDETLIQLIAEGAVDGRRLSVEPAADRKEAMRSKLMHRVRAVQPSIEQSSIVEPPIGSFTLREKEGDWVDFSPEIKFKQLAFDERENVVTILLHLLPGAVFPEHENQSDEECYVLQGSIRFGDHPVNAGDFHFMRKGYIHPEMRSDSGALVYLRTRLA